MKLSSLFIHNLKDMDLQKIRADFPILSREVYGKPLVYFDNGATTQKPRQVVDAITDEYYSVNANVHRGVHFLSQQATELHEASRETVRKFINARSTNEIVFTRGTTESINLLVSSFGDEFMQEGDEVILSVMEHHSNIVPWQLLAAKKGITIKVIPMNDKGELLQDEYKQDCQRGPCLQCAGYGESCQGNDTLCPRAGRSRTCRRCPVHSAHAGGCTGFGRRLLRLFRS